MTQLAKLADLAKDSSIAGRKSLIGILTDMYLAAGDTRSDQISFLFGDIALRILGQLEEETRAALAERVCHDDMAPHQLMLHLAQDSVPVAKPVLQNSPVLLPQDLVSIASKASMEHLGAIATRERVEQAVTSILVDRGDQTVLSKVAENKGADFADSSFVQLLNKAGKDERIQAALMVRPDLSDEAGRLLLPMLGDDLKKRVGSLNAGNSLVKLMNTQADEARTKHLERLKLQADALVQEIDNGKLLVDDVVRRIARSGKPTELGLLLAGISKLPAQAVLQLLFTQNDKPLVTVCKAIGVTTETYKDVLMMRAQRLRIDGMELNDAIQRFGLMNVEAAHRSLEVLRQSCEPAAAEAQKPREQPEAPRRSSKRPSSRAPRKNVPFAAQR